MEDVLEEFLVETHEGLDQLDRDLVTLEQEPSSQEILGQIFRTIHTIKGTSGFLALNKLGAIAHVGENLLSLMRSGDLPLSPEITSALLAMADAIREILDHVEHERAEGDKDYSALVDRLTGLAAPGAATRAAPAATAAPAAGGGVHGGGANAVAGDGPARAAAGGSDARSSVVENSIRVDVGLLDSLMNLVGELVLARNQILQFTATAEDTGFLGTCQRLDLVTTELQEGVMKTRMQPIGNLWTKFPRVVRDLALSCGKRVAIEMEGHDTELDKTIIESIKDPLVHAIRNAVDHGIEPPAVRRGLGKPEEGRILLRAFHEGGQVNIEITDDGGGIDPARVRAKAIAAGVVTQDRAGRMSDRELLQLIMLPGFSTAEKVTSVSGRGVGMDVVKTNIEKIGGSLDIHSVPGKGTTLKIKIPLTLAIIPALIVISGGERFAIPQVNLLELVRLEGEQARRGIENVNGAPVYRLRGNLLPLAHLDTELGNSAMPGCGGGEPRADEIANIVVLRADDRQFGLVVQSILDTEEIVVKPLGKQLKHVPAFAGAAIMGDGKVALIIDVMGLATKAGILAEGGDEVERERAVAPAAGTARETLLLVATGDAERVAVPLSTVARLEEFEAAAIERTAGHEVVQYRDEIMPLLRLSAVLGSGTGHRARDAEADSVQVVVVRSRNGRSVGFVVDRILDIIDEELRITPHRARRGLRGAATLQGRVTDLLDVQAIVESELGSFVDLEPAEALS